MGYVADKMRAHTAAKRAAGWSPAPRPTSTKKATKWRGLVALSLDPHGDPDENSATQEWVSAPTRKQAIEKLWNLDHVVFVYEDTVKQSTR